MRVIVSLLLFFSFFSFASSKQILVVTELSPPHQTLVNGEVSGSGTAFIRDIFKAAGLSPDIHMYPWARAYKLATTLDNTFIYSLARTPEREAKFHWIGAPVGHFELGFISLSSRSDISISTTEDAKKYKIAMQRNDFATDTLSKIGFEVVLTSDIKKSYALLLANKVDLIVDDKNFMVKMVEYLGYEKNHLSFLYKVDELTINAYLAANINTDLKYIKALNEAYFEVVKTTPLPYDI
ncbi:amino acid ABC transporter substrate-binding protein [Pseudoalteromonas sp. S3776]|uniref:substrate-binding periplasmic protein n=1 Tax=Pseudoalteromonas sp. S3776 TaxID=579544 RepID=UPI001109A173|nr:transporter substrate-binding domain-containing protein [Pseudoalteromonas sp. S3776]TMO82382.1 amino acid ABC transporter substrate-binding protein [Pseudoalteromonas sp. S3776]